MTKIKTQKQTYTERKWDTKIGVIEKKYGIKLGVPQNMKLGAYFEKQGYKPLADMLR